MQTVSQRNERKKEALEKTLARTLLASKRTISVAESCTGGLISHRLTTIPGSSKYFIGGVVAYSNEVKISLLNVPEKDIKRYGVVSSEVARSMAEGVAKLFGTDISISVTGIAGPGGGSDGKPVGTAYMGFVVGNKTFTKKVYFTDGRLLNKIHFSHSAFTTLLQNL